MTAPSNANTSGLEVVGWIKRINEHHPIGLTQPGDWRFTPHHPVLGDGMKDDWFDIKDVVTAASAQAVIDEQEETIESLKRLVNQHYDRATAAEARADRLANALERQADNMAFVLNHAPVGNWYEKFSTELADDRAALQQETQP